MTVEEFRAWPDRQPGHWELFDGVPVAMAPERVIHGDLKYRVARALDLAIAKSGVPCRFVLDSVAVRIDPSASYQPDALLYCGAPVPPDALEVPNPILVVEILSPSSALKDLGDKLANAGPAVTPAKAGVHYGDAVIRGSATRAGNSVMDPGFRRRLSPG